ncbi:hypothetical protein, partial [Streptococcus sp.]|uniref:hypothetical protein n=1 Tax=Streptococcus sp. TaxID=1306 RepID=UPI003AF0DE6C
MDQFLDSWHSYRFRYCSVNNLGLIIDLLNNFLNYIHIPDTPLNPDVFQGVFVKKLSNQNIIKEKRRISANNTILKVNQTHIDVTGEQAKLFFFEG